MSRFPLDREAITPTAETLAVAGDLARTTTALGIGGIWNPGWINVASYPELRYRAIANVVSAAGGVELDWSNDEGATVIESEPVQTLVAAAQYDSGAIVRAHNWVRPRITNGPGAQATFRASLEGYQVPGGSGGGGGVPAADMTPNGPALGVSTAVAVNVVVNIAATVVGQRYRVSVVGGAGFCIRVDATDPVVTDEPWQSDQKFTFIATVTSASGVRAIKRIAGTADGTVILTAIV